MPNTQPERVAIVGGGFSGVMTAVNLARLSKEPLRVTLINHQRPAGRGVAYGMRRPEHLLNVAARNMSALPDEPDHFLQWLRTRSEFDTLPEVELRERFIPRMVYGDYLRTLMQHHLQSTGGMTPVATEFVAGEATDIEPDGETASVHLADGRTVEADRVVLATGNEPPAPLPGAEPSATIRRGSATPGNPGKSGCPARTGASSCWARD